MTLFSTLKMRLSPVTDSQLSNRELAIFSITINWAEEKNKMLAFTFLDHSGFLVETDRFYLIFDYKT